MTFQMSEFAANGCVEAAVEWQSQPGHFLDLSWMIELFDWMCFTCYHLIFAWIPFFSFSFPFSGLKFPLDWTVFKLRRLEYFCTVAFWFMVERWCRRRLGDWEFVSCWLVWQDKRPISFGWISSGCEISSVCYGVAICHSIGSIDDDRSLPIPVIYHECNSMAQFTLIHFPFFFPFLFLFLVCECVCVSVSLTGQMEEQVVAILSNCIQLQGIQYDERDSQLTLNGFPAAGYCALFRLPIEFVPILTNWNESNESWSINTDR